MEELPPLIRAFIAQLTSQKFLDYLERIGGHYKMVDIILYANGGKPAKAPTITVHTQGA